MGRPSGKQQTLNREAVVRAAADIANSEGLDALTVNRLARELRVQPPSLYNHVNGRAELLAELALLSTRELGKTITDAAVGRSGAEAVRSVAQAYRAYIKTNPGLYAAGVRVAGEGPQNGRSNELKLELGQARESVVHVAIAVVASFGLSGDDAVHAVRALRGVVHGFATLETAGGFGLPLDCDESFRRLVEVFIAGLGRNAYSPGSSYPP